MDILLINLTINIFGHMGRNAISIHANYSNNKSTFPKSISLPNEEERSVSTNPKITLPCISNTRKQKNRINDFYVPLSSVSSNLSTSALVLIEFQSSDIGFLSLYIYIYIYRTNVTSSLQNIQFRRIEKSKLRSYYMYSSNNRIA